MTRAPVITIDGPAGAGKSTAARLLAERLGYTLVPRARSS
jgi:CMP/dCMP kinase